MGKRSNFKRNPRDLYSTFDRRLVEPLLRVLPSDIAFIEPCAGWGALIDCIEPSGRKCIDATDIHPLKRGILKCNALDISEVSADYIITNPPWSKEILDPLIKHFSALKPTWLLMLGSWINTQNSLQHIGYCHECIPVARARWIPNTKHDSLDDMAWFFFDQNVEPSDTVKLHPVPSKKQRAAAKKLPWPVQKRRTL